MENWGDFYAASAGAAGALGGLLLAAVSVNIEKIIAFAALPPRVAATLIAIGGALVVASVGLFPALPETVFGGVAIAVGIVVGLAGLHEVGVVRRDPSGKITFGRATTAVVLIEMVGVPFLAGGILLVFGVEAGLYVIATAIVLSYVTTLVNGWVLLIEILR